MAETIVKEVLEKITDPFVTEVLHLCGVAQQVENVRRELDWIRAFLSDADMKQIQEERQRQWVLEVRYLVDSIEDVIDTFLCEIPQKKPGKKEAMKWWFGKTKRFLVIRKFGDEMNQILESLKDIIEKRDRYGINSLGDGSGGIKKLPLKLPVLPDIEDPDVVGLDEDRNNIVKELLDETTPKLCVVSIVGPGGLGKTTLAKKVYNRYSVLSFTKFPLLQQIDSYLQKPGCVLCNRNRAVHPSGKSDQSDNSGPDSKQFNIEHSCEFNIREQMCNIIFDTILIGYV